MVFENPLDRIIIPTNGPETLDPYVDIGVARKPDGTLDNSFAGIALYSPETLPSGYAYIMRIAEVPPDTTVFVIQLYDANNPGSAVKSVLSAVYDRAAGTQILTVGGDTDILAIGPAAASINIGGPTADVDIESATSIDVTAPTVILSGDLEVLGNDLSGSGSGTFFIAADNPIVQIGGLANFDRLWIGSSGNATEIQKDTRSLGFNYEAVTDLALAETETSATFQAITTASTTSFVKERVNTRVGSGLAATWFSTVANTGAEFGLNFNNGAGINVTVTHAREQKTLANTRSGSTVGFAETAGGTLGAGTYTVTLMWRRFVGTGTLTTDSNDSASFYVREEIAP